MRRHPQIVNNIYRCLILFLVLSYGLAQDFNVEEMFSPTSDRQDFLPEFDDGYGVLFRDLNGDSKPDIYVVRFRNLNRFFLNRSTRFTDRTIQSGLGGNLQPRGLENLELGAASGDFDNDGREDVLIVGWGQTTRLFQQTARGEFSDITESAGLLKAMSGNGASLADIDLDGDLDILVTDEHAVNHLFIQGRPNHFSEESSAFGLKDTSISQGAAFGDIDQDGYPDLYVCNWRGPDRLYRNLNGEGFERLDLKLPHLLESFDSNSAAFTDIDNDGDLDLLVTDRQGLSRLYSNESDPASKTIAFSDITSSAGIANPWPAYSGIIADLDNNGWPDIFFTTIGSNCLYLNQGGKFTLAWTETVPKPYYSTGAAAADLDRDGDLDLMVANKDTNCVLYLNPLDGAASIRIEVEGIASNRGGIGTRVWLYAPGSKAETPILAGYREIGTGFGYLSGSETSAHFGVQPDAQGFSARLRFPSGIEKTITGLTPGQVYRVSEYSGFMKWAHLKSKAAIRRLVSPLFWLHFGLYFILVCILSGFVALSARRYGWSVRQNSLFLLIVLTILFLVEESLGQSSRMTIIASQLLVLAVGEILMLGFLERIHLLKRQQYGYRRTLKVFADQLLFIRDNRTLVLTVVNTLKETLTLRACDFWEVSGDSAGLIIETADPDRKTTPLSDELLKSLMENAILDQPFYEAFHGTRPGKPIQIFPVKTETEVLGFLELMTDEVLVAEDRSILVILANQIALTMVNNRYIAETKILTEQVTEARIREQYIQDLEKKNVELVRLFEELKTTQSQLIQSEKMSSLGQLVAGIAHELNNPIGYIYANLSELETRLRELKRGVRPGGKAGAGEIEAIIAESMEGSRRVKGIVESLRNFSRLDEAEETLADLHQGLDSTLGLMQKEFGDRIKIVKEYGTLPPVHCQAGQINQVFLNLLLNAAQAIEKEGIIRITTKVEADSIVIDIADSGVGMSSAECEKVFDPFYSTKPIGMGTGLGLSISYGIVKNHSGALTVISSPGQGSVFTVRLPVNKLEKVNAP